MIDDALLEDALWAAAEDLRPPADGPARIVAAAGTRPTQTKRTRSKRPWVAVAIAGLAAAVVLPLAFTGGGGAPSHPTGISASTGRSADNGGATLGGTKSATGAGGGANALQYAATPAGATPPPAAVSNPPNLVPTLPSRIIKTGTVNLLVPQNQLQNAVTKVEGLADGCGGFLAGSTASVASTANPANGTVTLRVPVANFERLLNDVERQGTVTSANTSSQDVTSQYVDLQARIQSLQDARTQYLEILSKAQSIGDLLAVQQQISDLQTQIEQLQGQQQVMNDQTSYSTLTVHIAERAKPAPTKPAPRPSGLSKAWAHARHSFARGFEAVIGATGGIAVFLMFAGLIGLAARLGWVLLRRRLV